MKHDEERLDLSALDPERDPERLERVVRAVMDGLGPGVVPDPMPLDRAVTGWLARRFRPLVAAAALVALLAGATLAARRSAPGGPGVGSAPVALPPEWGAWVAGETAPSTEQLLFQFAGDVR